jgi:sucrose-6-phosphate hydrolase SacC (GH32 family)
VANKSRPVILLKGTLPSEIGPHGDGNVYAPDVHFDQGKLRMWYGGQGKDGHDRIHYAESSDGLTWSKRGVVFDDATANHVNDPSVIPLGDHYLMLYTVAGSGVTDRIDVATSQDGLTWRRLDTAIKPGANGTWDSLLVGRPSVLLDEGVFKMWFDGRKDLPLAAPDPTAAKSPNSRRAVGYATSNDGIHWKKHDGNPVFAQDAGGVHVSRSDRGYSMVFESRTGTMIAHSKDGIEWDQPRVLQRTSGLAMDAYGHVTPCLSHEAAGLFLYTGAAPAASWDRNSIVRFLVDQR